MKTFLAFLLLISVTVVATAQTRSVELTWEDLVNGPTTTYNIYRAAGDCTGTPAFAKRNTAPVTAKTYLDPVSTGTYCYTVTAVEAGLESEYADAATTAATPSKVTKVKAVLVITIETPSQEE